MKRKKYNVLLVCAIAGILVTRPMLGYAKEKEDVTKTSAASLASNCVEDELLVLYKDERQKIQLPKGTSEEEITKTISRVTAADKSGFHQTAKALLKSPDVAYVEPNYKTVPMETNDRYFNKQWPFFDSQAGILAKEAWDLGSGANKEALVAVLDTGIDYLHADLKDQMWFNEDEVYQGSKDLDKNGYPGDYYGWNFVDDSPVICAYEFSKIDQAYVDYHGTHIAGIIGAKKDNEIGIAGVASGVNVKLMSVKVLGNEEGGTVGQLIQGIDYAQENGAVICNISLGTESYSKLLYDTIKKSNMLFVCAAGNGTKKTKDKGYDIEQIPMFPASYDLDQIISVASANESMQVDDSSCYSSRLVDIAAPGMKIVSTYVDKENSEGGSYIMASGTSMAAPHVTGTAALLYSYYGGLSSLQMRERILSGSKKVEAMKEKVAGGAYLNVYGALTAKPKEEAVMTLSAEKKTIQKDSRYALKAVIDPDDTSWSITYTSSDMTIAKVSGRGSIRAAQPGTAVITVTAKSGDYELTSYCNVTVKE